VEVLKHSSAYVHHGHEVKPTAWGIISDMTKRKLFLYIIVLVLLAVGVWLYYRWMLGLV